MQQAPPAESSTLPTADETRVPDAIRKIAALVATVDACAAQQILTQLPQKIARQVRITVKELNEVTPEEQARIYAELAVESEQNTAAAPERAIQENGYNDDEEELAAWQSIGASNLAQLLRDERPLIIAVVLTQLNDQFAAEVLSLFDVVQSRNIVRAAAELGEVPLATQQSIRRSVADQIQQMQEQQRRKQASLQRVQSIIERAPEPLRNEWSAAVQEPLESPPDAGAMQDTYKLTLATHESLPPNPNKEGAAPRAKAWDNPALGLLQQTQDFALTADERRSARTIPLTESRSIAHTTQASIADFAELIRLPKDSIAAVMKQLDEETILIALAGAPPEWATEFESLLSREEFRLIEQGIHSLGALSLADIDRAQCELVSAANRLLANSLATRASA